MTMAGRGREERGQALPLALLFLAGISVMVIALLGRSFTSETTTVALRQTLNTQYAADAAVSEAIANLRGGLIVAATSTPPSCGLTNPVTVGVTQVRVYCTGTSASTTGVAQAAITIIACPGSGSTPCPTTALLRASVTFTQQASGSSATITSWAVLNGGP